MISTFPSCRINIDKYKAIKKYLCTFGKERLAQTGEKLPTGVKSRKKTVHKWYELQDTCAYHEVFSSEKLFWANLTTKGRFTYSPNNEEIYCVNSVYLMTGPSIKYLAAFLNSSLITWFVNKMAATTGVGTASWIAETLEAVPVPQNKNSDETIVSLVDEMINATAKKEKQRIAELNCAIEEIVFEAYGISKAQLPAIIKQVNEL